MRGQHKLDAGAVEKEIKRLNDAMFSCNCDPVGSMSEDKGNVKARVFSANLIIFQQKQ